MMRTNEEYPELGEFVIGTVKEIFKQGAFITLDEYGNKRGMLHLSEISLKWVRNIRDYVKEGQKVVVLILKLDTNRGHIDLSLRRVTESQKKSKLQEVKQLQRAEKLLDVMASTINVSRPEIQKKVSDEILAEYETVYAGLEAIAADHNSVNQFNIPEKWKKPLVELVEKNIKAPYVKIKGYVTLKSYNPNGVDIIKGALAKISEYKTDGDLKISYMSAPLYCVKVKSKEYKSAEKILESSANQAIQFIKKNGGEGEFQRTIQKK